MKACKFCGHGESCCDDKGFCTYCYINWLSGYPVRKEPYDCCENFEPTEDEDEEF